LQAETKYVTYEWDIKVSSESLTVRINAKAINAYNHLQLHASLIT
jgi:hypothetical protein